PRALLRRSSTPRKNIPRLWQLAGKSRRVAVTASRSRGERLRAEMKSCSSNMGPAPEPICITMDVWRHQLAWRLLPVRRNGKGGTDAAARTREPRLEARAQRLSRRAAHDA